MPLAMIMPDTSVVRFSVVDRQWVHSPYCQCHDGRLAGRVSGEHHSVQSVAKKLTDERDRVVVGSR